MNLWKKQVKNHFFFGFLQIPDFIKRSPKKTRNEHISEISDKIINHYNDHNGETLYEHVTNYSGYKKRLYEIFGPIF